MQSPKFPFKVKDIQSVINAPRLKSRWRAKVRDAMRSQAIPDPIENLDFHTKLDANCDAIASEICAGAYSPFPPIRFLAEKSKGLCRQIVIPSVKDALILQTLSDALWDELKNKAPSKNAFYQPNDHRFSNMIRGQNSDYGPVNAWLKFQETIFGFTKTRKFVVITDIANFYDFISYDHLRNILAALAVTKEHSLDLLIYTLSHMLWQPDYMPRVQIGMPQINLDAPRLLAHCFLFEVDELLKRRPVDFARYMDDMDIGVDTVAQGKAILRDLDLTLQTRQVRLNSGKTKILPDIEAAHHFRIRDNAFLDKLENSISKKLDRALPIDREKRFLRDGLHWGLALGFFDAGNGEKILKRVINYMRLFDVEVAAEDFLELLMTWPSIRPNILAWWRHNKNADQKLPQIRDFIKSAEIVDDKALIDIATSMVMARLPKRSLRLIYDIANAFDGETKWGFYAKAWTLSKYGQSFEIVRLVETSPAIWVTEEHLARLVAGMYPRVVGTADMLRYAGLVRRRGGGWGQDVLDFHEALMTKRDAFTSIQSFVRAPNPTHPNRISHSKFLMLRSLAENRAIAPTAIGNLKATHAFALADDFYSVIMPP